MSLLKFISFISYQRAIYIHLALLIFIILPSIFAIKSHVEDKKETVDFNIHTMSEQDYLKIIQNTQSKQTNINFSSNSSSGMVNTTATQNQIDPTKDTIVHDKALKSPEAVNPADAKMSISTKQVVMTKKILPAHMKKQPSLPNKTQDIVEKKVTEKDGQSATSPIIDQTSAEEAIQKNKNNPLLPLDEGETAGIFNNNIIIEEGSGAMNVSIKDLIAIQIKRCWDKYYTDNNYMQRVSVVLIIDYDIEGFVTNIIVEPNLYTQLDFKDAYKKMSHNAVTAVKECSPLMGMPKSQYNKWKKIRFKFTHKKVS